MNEDKNSAIRLQKKGSEIPTQAEVDKSVMAIFSKHQKRLNQESNDDENQDAMDEYYKQQLADGLDKMDNRTIRHAILLVLGTLALLYVMKLLFA